MNEEHQSNRIVALYLLSNNLVMIFMYVLKTTVGLYFNVLEGTDARFVKSQTSSLLEHATFFMMIWVGILL